MFVVTGIIITLSVIIIGLNFTLLTLFLIIIVAINFDYIHIQIFVYKINAIISFVVIKVIIFDFYPIILHYYL